ncbi:helix-turn-helix transcriptional regulator [Pseudonocardia kunmingensis]|uniref:helix-turn-helix transcriptional regulator n=1 Tax=Pseudonocardia kunmingensis TaxID=630975 RepID=UPI001FE6C907|nr:helix-turn-helix transcriptional regulator [Pseudonocardia kunmingensis]
MPNLLGEFLRARRELTRPEDHGLPVGRRRVPGLRREEVAMLAGISADYYLRLERGRDRHPSTQVVEALARVLELDAESTAYLASLAAPAPRVPRRSRREPERAAPEIVRLLESMAGVPAFVLGRCMDVLAANRLCELLCGTIPGDGNIVRHVFLDPGAREFYPDWSDVAEETVAALRASAADAPDDPRLVTLVGELSVRSDEFRRLWARHDVRAKAAGRKRLVSPVVGEVTVGWESLAVASAPGQLVVTYFAEPGSPSAAALARLQELAARQ